MSHCNDKNVSKWAGDLLGLTDLLLLLLESISKSLFYKQTNLLRILEFANSKSLKSDLKQCRHTLTIVFQIHMLALMPLLSCGWLIYCGLGDPLKLKGLYYQITGF